MPRLNTNEPIDTDVVLAAGDPRQALIVDDEVLFAKAVVRRLERAGFICVHAATLAAARAAYAAREADLILLDLRLPDGSGLDYLRELRAVGSSGHRDDGLWRGEDAVQAMKCDASTT